MSLVSAQTLDLEVLLAPVDTQQPAGVFDEENETFQAIDHEMVKLGGLHEAAMDWGYIEEASSQYLVKQCKHFRIAGHLIAARLRDCSWGSWADAAALLAGMVEHYWEASYPKPGPKGYPAKRRQVALLVERLSEALPALGPDDLAKPHQERAHHAIDRLQGCAAAAELDVPMLTRLEAQFQRRVEDTRFPSATPAKASRQPAGGPAISEAYFSGESSLKLGDERETKRSLLAVAELINQQNAYDPTGYLLRRFALWAHLNAAPATRREQRTELMGVPADVAESYQEALVANNVSPVLLQRVEKSVTSSPYWIRGSFIAASIAQRLEMAEVAAAIRLAAERFIARIPGLRSLQFMDGRPFVDEETLAWLSGVDEPQSPAVESREYDSLRTELAAHLDSGGVERLLQQLESLQGAASDLRDQCHVMTIAADLLGARGFPWLAGGLYQTAFNLMSDSTIERWEPALFNHLAKRKDGNIVPGEQGQQV